MAQANPAPRLPPAPARAGRIARWKLAGGIALHMALPAYLLALAGDGLAHGAPPLAQWAPHLPSFSLVFLAAYIGLSALATGAAAGLDGRAQRQAAQWAATPPQQARAHCAAALAQARTTLGAPALPALDAIAAAPWAFADSRWQAAAEDLAMLVATHAESLATSPPERHEAIRARGCEALAHLRDGLETLALQSSDSAEDRAMAAANYIRQRYGQEEVTPFSDFSGGTT